MSSKEEIEKRLKELLDHAKADEEKIMSILHKRRLQRRLELENSKPKVEHKKSFLSKIISIFK